MTKWNKITQRPLTKAEKELSPDFDFMWVGQTPEFLETVLVHADGETYVDTWQDFGAYGAGFEDADCEVIYWMALPVPKEQVELELAENKPILDYGQEFNELSKKIKGFAEQYGIDVNRDEFCLIQPYDEGHSITMRAVEEDGQRQLKVEIFDNLHILPVKSGTLSIFKEVADDSEV